MCFTPAISLSTFLIEFAIATFILFRYKNYLFPFFWAMIIYVLGFYQLTEFMLCSSSHPFFWARLGFATFSFLPAMILHFALRIVKIKFNKILIYIPPILSAIFVFWDNLITRANCTRFFIETNIYLRWPLTINALLYTIYYFGFILLAIFILIKNARTLDKIDKKLSYLIVISLLIISLPPIFLIFIFPLMGIRFPSVYCEFALLFSIVALITCKIYDKKKKKELFYK